VSADEWIAVTDGRALDDLPRWAPGGDRLYYISSRDGFLCIWSQRLDPATKKPVGPPDAAQHFHARRHSIGGINYGATDLAVTRDSIIFNLAELRGNIWMAELK
jgi:hypothetical protein